MDTEEPRATNWVLGDALPGPLTSTRMVNDSTAPELEELLLEPLDEELLEEELLLDELLLLKVRPLLDELLELLLLVETLPLDELLEDELLVGFTPPLLSPESLELHAATNNEHINASKILGTIVLQAV